jgi:hypothetical protein
MDVSFLRMIKLHSLFLELNIASLSQGAPVPSVTTWGLFLVLEASPSDIGLRAQAYDQRHRPGPADLCLPTLASG